jgi:WD40 repeat protein/uncharacterized caspase-like protein
MKIVIQILSCLCLVLSVCTASSAQKPELVVQKGHTGGVSSMAFGSDGRILASGSSDKFGNGEIKLWDVGTGKELRTLPGHSGPISQVAFSRPDGKVLVSGSESGIIKFWNVATGTELRTLTSSSDAITSLTFSPDGKILASGASDKTARLWDVATGTELHTLKGQSTHEGFIDVAFSQDGKTLTTASATDATIRLWDIATGKQLRALAGSSTEIESLVLGPDGQIVATIDDDRKIKLWNVITGKQLRILTRAADEISFVSFSPDGEILASVDGDATIKLWSVTSGKELRALTKYPAQYGSVRSVTFSSDSQTLATGNQSGTIKLWAVATGQELRNLTRHSQGVGDLAFSPDSRTLASGSEYTTISPEDNILANGVYDYSIKLWDVATGSQLRTLVGHSQDVFSISFSPDSRSLASGGVDRTIKIWEVATGRVLRTLNGHTDAITSVTFSPNGKILASGGFDRTVRLWDVATGRELHTLTGHSKWTVSVAFSPDGETLASCSADATIRMWDVATGKYLRTLSGHVGAVNSVAFTPDGNNIVSGGLDGTIKLWDVATAKELHTVVVPSDSITSVSLSPDGRVLVAATLSGVIKSWDVATRKELLSFTAHSERINSVTFSPGGKIFASGSIDAKIKLWEASTGRELISLIALDQKDWAVLSNGLFDASPDARKLMHYVIGLEVVTLDQMKDLYYLPGLLQKAMAGDPLPKVELFTAQDLFPEAEYQQLKPGQQTLIVKLRNRGGGIGPTQVLVNGAEVTPDARPAGLDPQAKEATLTIDLSNVKQLIPGKENKVEVIARNAAGSLSSKNSTRGVELVFVGPGKVNTEPPELYAIIGGVSKYVDNQLNLRYSAKDAEEFARALAVGATKFFSPDKVHIRLLASDKSDNRVLAVADASELAPSKENFGKVFAEFAAKAKPNDILVVYLSGHGVALKQPGGDSYLYLIQEAYTTDSSILAEEKIRTATTVSSEELVQWIKEIPTLKKALVLDTCAAGAAAESLLTRKEVPSDQIRALERLKDRTGFFVLMGSAADKVSYETTTYRQGLLTYSLLEALKGAKLHDGGYADVGQLFDYAQDRVPQLAQNIGAVQQPRSIRPDTGSPFDIGLYTPDEQKLFSLPTPNPLILRPSLQNKALGYDNLKLVPVLQRALLEVSYVSTRGRNEPSLVFVDASEMRDAFMPVGSYSVAGSKVTINLNLIRNDEPVTTLTVEGTVADEPSKAALVQKLVTAISAETQKLIH